MLVVPGTTVNSPEAGSKVKAGARFVVVAKLSKTSRVENWPFASVARTLSAYYFWPPPKFALIVSAPVQKVEFIL